MALLGDAAPGMLASLPNLWEISSEEEKNLENAYAKDSCHPATTHNTPSW